MKALYEDDFCIIKETGNKSDFIITVENKTNHSISIEFSDPFDFIEPFDIEPKDWVGLLKNDLGEETLKAIKQNCFTIEY